MSGTSRPSLQVGLVKLAEACRPLVERNRVTDLHGIDGPGTGLGLHQVDLVPHVRTFSYQRSDLAVRATDGAGRFQKRQIRPHPEISESGRGVDARYTASTATASASAHRVTNVDTARRAYQRSETMSVVAARNARGGGARRGRIPTARTQGPPGEGAPGVPEPGGRSERRRCIGHNASPTARCWRDPPATSRLLRLHPVRCHCAPSTP